MPKLRADLSNDRQVFSEREVTLVFLRSVQFEYCVQSVEKRTQVRQVGVVWGRRTNLFKQLAKAPYLVRDLGVAATHCRSYIWRVEHALQLRIQLAFFCRLMRRHLSDQDLVYVADALHRGGWRDKSEPVCRNAKLVDVRIDCLVLVPETTGDCCRLRVKPGRGGIN